MRRGSIILVSAVLAAAGVGCFFGHDQQEPGPGPAGISVAASVSSAALAEDCVDPGEAGAPRFADCDGDCPSFCQQSQMQLLFEASEGERNATIEVVEVRLVDAVTGEHYESLTPRDPQVWDETESYGEWSGLIAPSQTLRTSWSLSAPDWATIGGGEPWSTYGMRFRLEVVLRIDGRLRTIESAEISREPEIAT